LAFDVGRALGAAGFAVLNGGYDGTMKASSEGARSAGARTIGVTCPAVLRFRGEALQPNPFLDEVYETPTIVARIETMMRACGGYVFLEGGTGTLSELGLMWEHVNKGFISARPVVTVGEFWEPLVSRIAAARPGADRNVFRAQCADEVAALMTQHAVGTRTSVHLQRLGDGRTS
jgi:uncharacterized protein (TIGR00725 family)